MKASHSHFTVGARVRTASGFVGVVDSIQCGYLLVTCEPEDNARFTTTQIISARPDCVTPEPDPQHTHHPDDAGNTITDAERAVDSDDDPTS